VAVPLNILTTKITLNGHHTHVYTHSSVGVPLLYYTLEAWVFIVSSIVLFFFVVVVVGVLFLLWLLQELTASDRM
jgi:hypothetical protein